ncbi:flagellar protein FlgJ [Thermoclostridium stercorarium subsp. stercorarium DSM 8532]|uniref:Flagellar protein FlgJ n=3 Tax=Thermoclostridium stercorarium TaxID=1510 RepID=L7VGN8_THES1|nr:rod-binding protein [Thermoclostridium stercorarium]AGC67120.1 flagellar protein FlgJ [Thermoclostridium stercorarium subsp. stercorarium DSM 8532]AGI38200.1 rod-binding protein [Thermoclostridium stercorarium subsp. stercorarium DSM 8532]ANW97605.1 flagellar biosynthesis protein FlgJ [Thermoclostridium stercorarium subsp. thermolacticum DSM 2910]ANX00165.1 flagellar biosynthesis protein FlgJ [Thermoclostridium stercorarium subsp. leptospartum DSM 9219]UZQ85720.1 rod-binding protein [Thermo
MKIDGIGALNVENTITYKQVSDEKSFEEVLKKAYTDGDKEKLREACREFEGILMGILFKQMKKTIPESSFVQKSYAREIFEEMLDEELINNASGRLGIADMLYKQLSANLDRIYKVSDNEQK